MATAGSSVIGVDWRVPLDEARRRIGPGIAVQGNLDPALCLSSWDVAAAETREVLRAAGTEPGPCLQPRPRRAPRDRPGHSRAGGDAGPRRRPGRRGGARRDHGRGADHRRAGHGPRDAGLARRDRILLHRHPARPTPHARAPRRAGRSLPGHRGDVTTDRADPGPGGRLGLDPLGRGPGSVRRALRGQVHPTQHRRRHGVTGPCRREPGRGHRAHPPRVVIGLWRVPAEGGGGGRIGDTATAAHHGDLVAPGRGTGPAPGRPDRRVPGVTARGRRTADGRVLHRPQPPPPGGGRRGRVSRPGGRVGRRHRRSARPGRGGPG